jgi:hypothetical protein
MIRITSPIDFNALLWPKFVCAGSHYYIALAKGDHIEDSPGTSTYELESREWSQNHYHLFGVLDHDIPLLEKDGEEYFQDDHEDFAQIWAMTKKLADIWALKLSVDFQGVSFVVVATRKSDPIIRFFCRRGDVFIGRPEDYFAQMVAEDTGYYVLTGHTGLTRR